MSKNLIIVESPAKIKTIKKFLGTNYMVHASVGHIRDLPPKEIGVDEETFMPKYVTIVGKEKVVSALQEAASKADTVYLAPDPDREGEAIAWHIAEIIKDSAKDIKRIQFNEITAKAVKEALANPREIDASLFEAQQARRILDRLVGYKISPLLWKSVKRGISAGRVQSVALRLVVEREEERLAFIPEEFWNFKAMANMNDFSFRSDLTKINNKKASIGNEEAALAIENALKGRAFIVEKVEEKERSRAPQAPFTTSTLQQAANQRLGFSAKRTMTTAQRLYEGMDIEGHGTLALITYMRTDSVRIADEAKESAIQFINNQYGTEYCAAGGKGRDFKGKKSIQDAHEAVRPVDVHVLPEQVKSALTPDQYRLYSLIWARFVASQMAVARFHDTVVTIVCENPNAPENPSDVEKDIYPFHSQWRTKGERLLFPGFLKVLSNADDKNEELPPLKAGQELAIEQVTKEQKFTQPSPRYTEASLVREMEERGIGRPSTYATIISTIQDREYVRLDAKHFVPTDLGNVVCSQLRDNFPSLMNVDFTAKMEERLDKVAEGELGWVNLLSDFSGDFNTTLEKASVEMKGLKTGIETDIACPTCAKLLSIKFGKSGEFLACSAYPECRFTSNFIRDEKGVIQIQAARTYEVIGTCPKCSGDVVLKKAHTGSRFLACANYPKCDFVAPYSTGVKCPKCDTGEIVEKSSKRGKLFYACNTYPKCDFALWDQPIAEKCPQCEYPVLVHKNSKTKGPHIACADAKCNYTRSEANEEDADFTPVFVAPVVQNLLAYHNIAQANAKAKASAKSEETAHSDEKNETLEKPKKTRVTKASSKAVKETESENINAVESSSVDSVNDSEVKPKKPRATKTTTKKAVVADTDTVVDAGTGTVAGVVTGDSTSDGDEKPKKKRVTKAKAAETAETDSVDAENTEQKPKSEAKKKVSTKTKDPNAKKILIYTDGSCLGNPGPGAYAAVMVFGDKRRELASGFARTTNNRMELLGVIESLNCLKEPCSVELYTDSQYVAKAITAGWLHNWKKNGWKTAQKKAVKNKDLWEQLDATLIKHDVDFHWVKGHAGHPENERCDELARAEAAKPQLPPDLGFEE